MNIAKNNIANIGLMIECLVKIRLHINFNLLRACLVKILENIVG